MTRSCWLHGAAGEVELDLNTIYILLQRLFFTSLLLASLGSLGAALAAQCEAESTGIMGKQTEAEANSGNFDKIYSFQTEGGTFAQKRYCANDIVYPDVTELFAFGKSNGLFRHYEHWSGRDLQLFDDNKKTRVIKTNITVDFERVLIFDEKGNLLVPLDKSETAMNTHIATRKLFDLYSAGTLPDGVLLLWLLQYHGEAQSVENNAVFFQWSLKHQSLALKFFSRLDAATSQALAKDLFSGVIEAPKEFKAATRFREAFPKGSGFLIDAVHASLTSMEKIEQGLQ
jgi:hypothetical protein